MIFHERKVKRINYYFLLLLLLLNNYDSITYIEFLYIKKKKKKKRKIKIKIFNKKIFNIYNKLLFLN